jgi:hypothetical protein
VIVEWIVDSGLVPEPVLRGAIRAVCVRCGCARNAGVTRAC